MEGALAARRSGADLDALEGPDARPGSELLLQGLAHAQRIVVDPGLLLEHDAGVELVQLAGGDLVAELGRLLPHLLALEDDRPLALDLRRRHLLAQRVGRAED